MLTFCVLVVNLSRSFVFKLVNELKFAALLYQLRSLIRSDIILLSEG